jgi:ribosomal protein S18 acetylase RimI-like enzyme
MSISIRDVNLREDFEDINRILRRSWQDAYEDLLTDYELDCVELKDYRDFDELHNFENSSYINSKIGAVDGNPAGYFVACSDTLSCEKNPYPEISLAYVDPDYQGQGVGSKALSVLEDEVQEHWGNDILRIEVFGQNESAKKFYQKNGYEFRENHLHGSGSDKWVHTPKSYTVMEKQL